MAELVRERNPSIPLTDDTGILRQASETYRGMAYFAGTGPAGKTCKDCKLYRAKGSSGICAEFARLMRKAFSFPSDAAACKKFDWRLTR